MKIKELDIVVLDSDLPQAGLKKGDVGTVVLPHSHGCGSCEHERDMVFTIHVYS